MGCKVLQSTIVAEVTRTIVQSSGWVRTLNILQMMNALRRDKRFGHTRLFSMCTAADRL